MPDHDASMIRTLFRGARFPDVEWWWNTAYVECQDERGRRRALSIITNVLLSGEPLRGEGQPSAVVAIRDVSSGEAWIRTARGVLSNGRACRFSSPGWILQRLDPDAPTFGEDAFSVGLEPADALARFPGGCYVVQVDEEDVEIDLCLRQESMARFGDEGWMDYDPGGQVPLWASTKARATAPSGTLRLGASEWTVTGGTGHFEQQCVLPSAIVPSVAAASIDPLGLARIAQSADLLPAWHWFRISLACGLRFSAFFLWSAVSGRPMHGFGAAATGSETIELGAHDVRLHVARQYRLAGVSIPAVATLRFRVPDGAAAASGVYQIEICHDPEIDWRVPYPGSLGATCLAHEAHAVAHAHRDGESIGPGIATQETIDLSKSLVRSRGE